MSTLDTEVTLSCEIDWELISRGYPARGPTYSCGGTPAEPPEFEITVRCNGLDITSALSDEQLDEIRTKVEEDYNAEPDAADDDFDPDDFDTSD